MCRCGNRGCLETLAGELGIVDVLRRSHGTDLTLDDVLRLAAEGDLGCRRAIADAGGHIGRATAACATWSTPSGSSSEAASPPPARCCWGRCGSAIERHAVPSAARDVTIVRGELGSRTETLGALALVIAESDRLVTHPARDPTIRARVPS